MSFHRRKKRLIFFLVLSAWLASLPSGFALAASGSSDPSTKIATYVLNSHGGNIVDDVPVTFGSIFAKGDVPDRSSVVALDAAGNALPTQIDVKARHSDGSLRHAVVTVAVPHLSEGRDFPIELHRTTSADIGRVTTSDLPSNFDAVVELTLKDGTTLKASAKSLLANGKLEPWLSGKQVSEWWVAGPLFDQQGKPDSHLSVRFGIRSYGRSRPLRVEINIENTWTWVPHPKTEFFDAQISANGRTIFRQPGMSQQAHTRWRILFWWDSAPDVFVKQPLDYLKKARVVPNYNPSAEVTEAELANYYAIFLSKDRRPLDTGLITHYMPTTGGRGDIGPFPKWAVYYLLTMDRRAYDMLLNSGDLAGSYMAHYRNEKTGRPATTEDFPNISTHSNYVGQPGNLEIPDNGGKKWDIVAQASHEPSLAFLPYLVTGDRYYLEELQFWSQFNAWGTAPERRGFAKSLIVWDEVRGEAWSLRTLAQAAYITPDDDPLKPVLMRELHANLDWYNTTYSKNPSANIFHAILFRYPDREYSPWMDDFLTWAAAYTTDLGFEDARPFAQWKAVYPVQRLINPDYCWVLASSYRMILKHPDLSEVTSWSEAYALTLAFSVRQPVEISTLQCGSEEMAKHLNIGPGQMFTSANPGGYVANLQPALAAAVDLDVQGASTAWNKLLSHHYPIDLQWDIVPWNSH